MQGRAMTRLYPNCRFKPSGYSPEGFVSWFGHRQRNEF
jgi:hypothetical protein